MEARPGAFWDWMNGNVVLDRITYELEEMKAKAAPEHSYGKGLVIADRKRVRDILQQRGIGPDFAYSSPGQPANLDYIHRRTRDADIYFVSNTQMEAVEADCTFCVAPRLPQLWLADTGEIKPCTGYTRVPGGMKLKLRLPPAGSVFVVFAVTAPESAPPPVVKQDDPPPAPLEITGPWDVRSPRTWAHPHGASSTSSLTGPPFRTTASGISPAPPLRHRK